jgi:hypothetical protein
MNITKNAGVTPLKKIIYNLSFIRIHGIHFKQKKIFEMRLFFVQRKHKQCKAKNSKLTFPVPKRVASF